MLSLSGTVIAIQSVFFHPSGRVLRVTCDSELPEDERHHSAFLLGDRKVPRGFPAYLVLNRDRTLHTDLPDGTPLVVLTDDFDYLKPGDLVRVGHADRKIRVLFRAESPNNSFLVTERCDNYCLMCSQPPKSINDDWIIDELLEAIPLVNPTTSDIGFTGGEPTLLKDRLIEVLVSCKKHLPTTGVHVLSNGRGFSDFSFAKKWADVQHPDLMVGIPIYSDVATIHDYVVQADGAFDETIRGILNLKRLGQKVEIRVVLHKQTYQTLPRLAEFITRNLLFVDHVALMGLEMMGFTRANLDSLWIDPIDYQKELFDALQILDAARLNVSIYNHQLCLLDRRLWNFAVRSISDWKNEYFEECTTCSVKEKCGGFFSSAKFKRSANIAPIVTVQP